ncbi:MAG: hypothetical protein GY839_13305 [candidate division Zixibacteria bacterium]|nr:hypothetical protein [candidate division Zixibacteria bacterium]
MELKPETIKNLTKEQLELLTELGELAAKETQLTEQIENNRRQSEKAGMGREREIAKNLMDDHEYDNLQSVKQIYEREQIKSKIKSVFESIINAGLGDLDLVQRQAANYGAKPNKE